MFHPLTLDYQHGAILARFTGTLTLADIAACDEAVVSFIATEGSVPAVIDLTGVHTVEITSAQVAARGRQPETMSRQKRVFVATGLAYGLCRMFSTYQEGIGGEQPLVVRTLPEAYAALGLTSARFQGLRDCSLRPEAAPLG